MHYSKENPSCSTFRVITANVWVSKILGFLQQTQMLGWPLGLQSTDKQTRGQTGH